LKDIFSKVVLKKVVQKKSRLRERVKLGEGERAKLGEGERD
jgi:hypothetical protein